MPFITQWHKAAPKPRLLIVEDNSDQWFIIHWALSRSFPEAEPIRVATPSEALAYLEACIRDHHSLPKLVLLDLYLPTRQTGLALLGELKAHPTYRSLPVVMLSQSDRTEDMCLAYRLHSQDYVIKPTNPDQWQQCVARLRRVWWGQVMLAQN